MSQNISTHSDLTNEEKFIYNSYLIANRKSKNKPFKLRKDFTDVSDEHYILLKKLGAFFEHNQTISVNDFFWAPYEVYSKDEYFDLHFYTTRKAIVAYTQFMRKKETQDADSEGCIDDCKRGLKHIYTECVINALTLAQYRESSLPIPKFLVDLKSHQINFYILHGLDVEKQIKQIQPELLDFYCKDFYNLYYSTRTKFITSTRLKNVIRDGLKIIEKKLLIYTKPNT